MPFSVPNSFSVTVTQDDINNSGVNLLNLVNNSYANSLVRCLQRLHAANLLPGELSTETPNPNVAYYASTNVRVVGGVVYLCDVLVLSDLYVADNNTAVIIAAENASIKPSGPYTVTFTLAV